MLHYLTNFNLMSDSQEFVRSQEKSGYQKVFHLRLNRERTSFGSNCYRTPSQWLES
jgi:hypothetical protein